MKKLVTMKFKYLLGLLLLITTLESYGQLLDFNDNSYKSFLIIDTIGNSNNIWQVGMPQKSTFSNAYSAPNALVTDTLNNYPLNDTSTVYLWHTAHLTPGLWPHLTFKFKIDTDTLNDYGIVAYSPDKGTSWVDVYVGSQSLGTGSTWQNSEDKITGSSHVWQRGEVILGAYDDIHGYTDSILFRFTFISDGLETNQNGWMIDDIYMGETIMSVGEITPAIESSAYPNPVDNSLNLQWEGDANASY